VGGANLSSDGVRLRKNTSCQGQLNQKKAEREKKNTGERRDQQGGNQDRAFRGLVKGQTAAQA